MFQGDFNADHDISSMCDDVFDASVDRRVVRDPEIVWISDVRSGVPDGGVRSIPEVLAGIEAAIGCFDPGQAEDPCWQLWSMSRVAGALELANALELLALSLDRNGQSCVGAHEEQRALLEAVRACLDDEPALRGLLVGQAA